MHPVADSESAFYWAGVRDHRLLLQRCAGCARHRFPPMPACPWCGAPYSEIVASPGEGEVYSWVTVHRAFSPQWTGDVPYVIATVELAERCRVFARLDVAPALVSSGLAVRARFVDHADGAELRFVPAGGGS